MKTSQLTTIAALVGAGLLNVVLFGCGSCGGGTGSNAAAGGAGGAGGTGGTGNTGGAVGDAGGCSAVPIGPVRFTVVDLGNALPKALNSTIVVGSAVTDTPRPQPNFWAIGSAASISPQTLPGADNSATFDMRAINAAGQIVGQRVDGGGISVLLWPDTNTAPRVLAAISGTLDPEPFGINSAGVVVGSSGVLPNLPVFWGANQSTPTPLRLGTAAEADSGTARGINASGQIAGILTGVSPVFWSNTQADPVPLPLPASLEPLRAIVDTQAINDGSQIAGNVFIGNVKHGLLWASPQAQPMDLGAGTQTEGLNNRGQVVGLTKNPCSDNILLSTHAMLFESAGGVQDLNSFIPASARWTLTNAVAINDDGLITGTGFHNGIASGFLLVPIANRTTGSRGPTAAHTLTPHGAHMRP